jgi:hypothetical protein
MNTESTSSFEFFLFDEGSNTTIDKIRRFSYFPVGWHFGEGVSIPPRAIETAVAFERSAKNLGFRETDAFPGIAGEVRIAIYEGEDYLEFTVEPDDSITYVRELNGTELEYHEGLTLQDAETRLLRYRKESWASFASSIQNISTSAWVGLRVSLLSSLLMEASQLSNVSVSSAAEEYSVTISESFTLRNPAAELAFGYSMKPYSLVLAT